jgi:hypothetical protein
VSLLSAAFKDLYGGQSVKPCKGAILFMDALGTQGAWNRSDPINIARNWDTIVNSFAESIESFEKELYNPAKPVFRGEPPFFTAFSDTIITTANADDLIYAISILGALLSKSFIKAMELGIYLRGAISVGEYYQAKHIIIGPAVDEAYDWHGRADWIGIMLAPRAGYLVDSIKTEDKIHKLVDFLFTGCQIPIHPIGNTERYLHGRAFNWPRNWKSDLPDKTERQKELFTQFSRFPISSKASSKYQNTLEFFNKQLNLD